MDSIKIKVLKQSEQKNHHKGSIQYSSSKSALEAAFHTALRESHNSHLYLTAIRLGMVDVEHKYFHKISIESPEIFASNIIQLNEGGIALKITKIIISVNAALKFEVFIFLFNVSKNLFPEYSILIKLSPIIPIMKGVKKLTLLGRKEIKFNLKKEFKKTSKILIMIKKVPVIKTNCMLLLSDFKNVNLLIIFP